MNKNFLLSLKSAEERALKPVAYRLSWHSHKGSIRRWFVEYRRQYPSHIREGARVTEKFLRLVPERHREHFCEYLDRKRHGAVMQRKEWADKAFTAAMNASRIDEAPPGYDVDIHTEVMNKLMHAQVYDVVLDRFAELYPELVTGKRRVKTGHGNWFDRFAAPILEAIRENYEVARAEKESSIEEFLEEKREAERKIRAKRVETVGRWREIANRNKAIQERREEAYAEKRNFLIAWRKKYLDVFREKIERGMSKNERNAEREMWMLENTPGGDPKMRAKEKKIRKGPATCYWCGKQVDKGTVDHIIPLSEGGPHNCLNTVAACRSCNSRKGSVMPDSGEMPVGTHLEMRLM